MLLQINTDEIIKTYDSLAKSESIIEAIVQQNKILVIVLLGIIAASWIVLGIVWRHFNQIIKRKDEEIRLAVKDYLIEKEKEDNKQREEDRRIYLKTIDEKFQAIIDRLQK